MGGKVWKIACFYGNWCMDETWIFHLLLAGEEGGWKFNISLDVRFKISIPNFHTWIKLSRCIFYEKWIWLFFPYRNQIHITNRMSYFRTLQNHKIFLSISLFIFIQKVKAFMRITHFSVLHCSVLKVFLWSFFLYSFLF